MATPWTALLPSAVATAGGNSASTVRYRGDTSFALERESNATPNAYGLDEVKRIFAGQQGDLVAFLATVRKDAVDQYGLRVKETPAIQDIDGPLPKVSVTYVGKLDPGAPLSVVTRDRQPVQSFSSPAHVDGSGGTVSMSYHAFETTYLYALKQSSRPTTPRFHGPSVRDYTRLVPFDVQPLFIDLTTPLATVCRCTEFAPERMGDYWGISETWVYSVAVNEQNVVFKFAYKDNSPIDPDPDLVSNTNSSVLLP